MKPISKKTKKMKAIEKAYLTPIEEILRTKFVDENKSTITIGNELGVSNVIIIKWLNLAGIYSHSLKL